MTKKKVKPESKPDTDTVSNEGDLEPDTDSEPNTNQTEAEDEKPVETEEEALMK